MQVKAKTKRYHFIDWLRALAVLFVFLMHSARFFAPVSAPIHNAQTSPVALGFFVFVHLWIMPLFFFLAGATLKIATENRSTVELIRQRVKRLVIPFLFGVIFLAPLQSYLTKLHEGAYRYSFLAFYVHSLTSLPLMRNPRILGALGHHLWFLAYLFIFSVLALPVFGLLRTARGQRLIQSVGATGARPGGIFLPTLPLIAIHILIRVARPAYLDWADFAYWFIVFMYGSMIVFDPQILQAISRQRMVALFVGCCCFTAMLTLNITGKAVFMHWLTAPIYSVTDVLLLFLWGLNTWSWVLFFTGIAIQYFDHSTHTLSYANEAVLPIYILHQTVLFAIGFYVVQLDLGILAKFLMLSTTAMVTTLAAYEGCVRRVNVLRLLFGMRGRQR